MANRYSVTAESALVKTGPGVLYQAVLSGGSDAATLILYDNAAGSGSQICATIKAAAGTTVTVDFGDGVVFGVGLYAALTGTTPSASVVWR
jgi:hypothetical protein